MNSKQRNDCYYLDYEFCLKTFENKRSFTSNKQPKQTKDSEKKIGEPP